MKKALTALMITAVIISSCEKASTDTVASNPTSTVSSPTGTNTTPTTNSEPFSAKFTYSAPDVNNIFENQTIHFESKASGVVSYVWKIGNTIKRTEQNPDASFAMHGYYPVTLTVTDKNGNTATSTQEVSILCNFGGSH